jgi:carboxylesterase type B
MKTDKDEEYHVKRVAVVGSGASALGALWLWATPSIGFIFMRLKIDSGVTRTQSASEMRGMGRVAW